MYKSKYFSPTETGCQCGLCGQEQGMLDETLRRADLLRDSCGFALPMSSGFRCPKHKTNPTGPHGTGKGFDLQVSHRSAYIVLGNALSLGFKGVGVSQKGGKRFIHLDDCENTPTRPRPHVWSY